MTGELVGRYRLGRKLGEGGMGMVFEAVREDIGGRAAVKLLHAELARNTEIATRFFNEARAANLLEHPSIVRIFDYGNLPDGRAYLAMEYLEGESLGGRLKRVGRMSAPDVLRISRQIASGLAAAHAKKVIHRDLKPANIMVVPDPDMVGGERVKILDFGIAKLAESGVGQNIHTKTGALIGTPAYMSPEQCRGAGRVDERTDTYSFGVMLFEMLAGFPPFQAEGQGELLALHMFQPPPPLQPYAPEAPSELVALVASMLAKDSASRPAMIQVAASLQKVAGQPGGTQAPDAPATGPSFLTSSAVPFAPPNAQTLPPSYGAGSLHTGARSSSSKVPVVLGGVLLLGAVGVGTFFLVKNSPKKNPPLPIAASLSDVDADLQAKRWSAALEKAQSILQSPDSPDGLKEAATAKKELASAEAAAKRTYDRFGSAAGSGEYDQAMKSYREIPESSVYRQIAREDYDRIFPLFVESHLKEAEGARGQGRCGEFVSQVNTVLALDPRQARALALKERPCTPAAGNTDSTLTEAQTEFVNGNYLQAISLAKSVQKANPVRAWRIIGGAACHIRDVGLANEAYRRLDAPGRQYMVYVCQREGLQITGKSFKLAE